MLQTVAHCCYRFPFSPGYDGCNMVVIVVFVAAAVEDLDTCANLDEFIDQKIKECTTCLTFLTPPKTMFSLNKAWLNPFFSAPWGPFQVCPIVGNSGVKVMLCQPTGGLARLTEAWLLEVGSGPWIQDYLGPRVTKVPHGGPTVRNLVNHAKFKVIQIERGFQC